VSSRPLRSLITVIMNLVFVLAILEAARLVVAFFGALSSQAWGEMVITVTDYFTIPFGVVAYKTPYGGVFDVDAGLTVVVFLLLEWILSLVRNRA